MPDVPPTIVQLVETFDRNIDAYTNHHYNEAQVRREFIDPFFEALGWDVTNEQGHAPAYRDVIHEDAIKVGGATKAPDYCFRIGGTRKFFLEAKKPSLDIKGDPHPAYQLRRYAWSAKLPLSILTDFEEFAVYDCRIRPKQTDKADAARIKYYTYKQYLDKWHDIESIFSKDAILKGSFDKFAASAKGKRGTSTVDAEFLAEIEKWRQMLARSIALRNPDLTRDQLNFAVQRTIDRILFLRMCEDRGIETYSQLLALSTGRDSYPRLCHLFRQADDKYNSGLFHFRREKARPDPDELTPTIKVDDKDLQWILHSLYYPQCPYEFSVLPAEILGNVYEQFLGKVIRLTPAHHAVVEEKPEVKKAGGVYYTPAYIVDYIVKNTVGKLLGIDHQLLAPGTAGGPQNPIPLTPKQISSLRILDPACGSGSFLLGAYTFLLDYHRDWYVAHDPEKHTDKIYQGRAGHYFLTIKEKKRILLNNIFGVDIDPQAVEVTKLALLLKVLEGENAETIGQVYKMFHERALPDLADNIKCGNSLIGPDFFDNLEPDHTNNQLRTTNHEPRTTNNDLHKKINPFDWNTEFPQIIKSGGFNAVIGNPPYIFTRELITPGQKAYYYQKYQCTQFKINTYFLFVENAWRLLNTTGTLGYIVPNNWLSLEYSSHFRHFLLTKTFDINITNILHRVFQKASVDTCILIFTKHGKSRLIVHEMADTDIKTVCDCPTDTYLNTTNYLIAYRFDTANRIRLCNKIMATGTQLSNICDVRNGVQAYTVGEGTPKQTEQMKNNRVYHSFTRIDDSWLRYVDGVDVKRYFIGWSKQFIKYGRNLSRPRKPYLFTGERLLVRQIPSKPPYSILASFVSEDLINDNNSMIVKNAPDDGHNLKYVMGLLNSRLISFWFLDTFGKLQRKVFPQFKVKELSQFPIRTIDFDNPDDVVMHHKMVALVERMLDLHKKLAAAKIPNEKTQIQRQITATDNQIDQLVYELYDLTEEEIKIVEGKK